MAAGASSLAETHAQNLRDIPKREFNTPYQGFHLSRVAFPLGGIGAGMICIEGTGAFSHFSLRNQPEIFNEPCTFAALHLENVPKGTRVIEGPVPNWKVFGLQGTASAGNVLGELGVRRWSRGRRQAEPSQEQYRHV